MLYIFVTQYVCSLGIEPTTFALLTQCSTTEPSQSCEKGPFKDAFCQQNGVIVTSNFDFVHFDVRNHCLYSLYRLNVKEMELMLIPCSKSKQINGPVLTWLRVINDIETLLVASVARSSSVSMATL